MGGTSISFTNYGCSGVAIFPLTTTGVFLGTTLGDIQEIINGEYNESLTSTIMLTVGAVFTLALIIYMTIVVRRYLKETTKKVELE